MNYSDIGVNFLCLPYCFPCRGVIVSVMDTRTDYMREARRESIKALCYVVLGTIGAIAYMALAMYSAVVR